jgi:hypothetical protein
MKAWKRLFALCSVTRDFALTVEKSRRANVVRRHEGQEFA